MEKEIELQERKVPYTLRHSKRAKNLRLSVYCNGAFVVTAPKNVGANIIEKFIIKKAEWILGKIDYFSALPKPIEIKTTRADFAKSKEIAQKIVSEKIEKFNAIYNFKFNSITIKKQKTRWGSCSTKGNLNFNYKIAFLPEPLADYLVVHELCHLGQFNHSRAFWALVGKTIPNYRELRTELQKIRL